MGRVFRACLRQGDPAPSERRRAFSILELHLTGPHRHEHLDFFFVFDAAALSLNEDGQAAHLATPSAGLC